VNLYLLHAPTRGYDTYRGAVVVAPDEETARTIHPNGKDRWEGRRWVEPNGHITRSWDWSDYAMREWKPADDVTVTLLGVAVPELGQEPRVLLTDFFSG
jgi:hypothetical protein